MYRYEDGRLRKIGSVDGQAGLAVEGAKGDVFVQREFGQPLGVRSELVLIKENGDPPVTQIESSAPKTILYDAAVIERQVPGLPRNAQREGRDRDSG